MTQHAVAPHQPSNPADLFLSLIVSYLTPLFLVLAGGDIAQAQAAALMTINTYRERYQTDLIAVAQVIVFGLAAIASATDSMNESLPLSLQIRLRGNANACKRSGDQTRRRLEAAAEYSAPLPDARPLDARELATGQLIAELQQQHLRPAAAAVTEPPAPAQPTPAEPAPASAPVPPASAQPALTQPALTQPALAQAAPSAVRAAPTDVRPLRAPVAVPPTAVRPAPPVVQAIRAPVAMPPAAVQPTPAAFQPAPASIRATPASMPQPPASIPSACAPIRARPGSVPTPNAAPITAVQPPFTRTPEAFYTPDEFRRLLAKASLDVAAECNTDLDKLSPDARREASLRAKSLAEIAADLFSDVPIDQLLPPGASPLPMRLPKP